MANMHSEPKKTSEVQFYFFVVIAKGLLVFKHEIDIKLIE
jgi:hypothetical protein